MFKLTIKLNNIKEKLTRTICIPEDIDFATLDGILRTLFGLSYYHLSVFKFPGLKTVMWDFKKTYPDSRAVDMEETPVSDYIPLFKKFTWTYDLSKSYSFTVNVKKANKQSDKDYPFVESYECDYNPIEDCHVMDFEVMLYCTLNDIEFPDYLPDFAMEMFDAGDVNRRFRNHFEK